jgi:hypothetical protein
MCACTLGCASSPMNACYCGSIEPGGAPLWEVCACMAASTASCYCRKGRAATRAGPQHVLGRNTCGSPRESRCAARRLTAAHVRRYWGHYPGSWVQYFKDSAAAAAGYTHLIKTPQQVTPLAIRRISEPGGLAPPSVTPPAGWAPLAVAPPCRSTHGPFASSKGCPPCQGHVFPVAESHSLQHHP